MMAPRRFALPFRSGYAATAVANLKVLYGIGAVKLTEANEVVRVGSIKYTVKDGIVFDARRLLQDVRDLVRAAKDAEGFEITQPGRGPFR